MASKLCDEQSNDFRQFSTGDEVFKLMWHKNGYPYRYMESYKKFKKTRLQPNNAFHSKLNMKEISDND